MAKVESSLKAGFCVALACGALFAAACSDDATPAGGGTGGSSGGSGTGGGSATGGGTGTGGATGTGGGTAGPSKCEGHYATPKGTCATIDSFEQDTAGSAPTTIPPSDGRSGAWSAPDKETKTGTTVVVSAKVEAVDAPAAEISTSKNALHFTVTGAIDWGGDVGVALGPCYDVTAAPYTCIRFWAKAAQKVTILAGVHTADSHGSYDCPPPGGDPLLCWGAYRTDVIVDTTWQKFEFTWDKLAQPAWALQVPFDKKKLVSVVFSSKDTNPVDVWIDDPGFIGGDDSMCAGGGTGDGGTTTPEAGGGDDGGTTTPDAGAGD
jgi:hypothetical protein